MYVEIALLRFCLYLFNDFQLFKENKIVCMSMLFSLPAYTQALYNEPE